MINSIIEAKRSLISFRDEINDFLPDTPGGNNYVYPWDIEDLTYVSRILYDFIDRILATNLRDHVALELNSIKSDMEDAVEHCDIAHGQQCLNDAMKEFNLLFYICKAFQEYCKRKGESYDETR